MGIEVNIPEEIIIEILSRLPVKSLIRFRSVSKSWHSMIIDPNFIKKHLSQATRLNNLNLKRALLCTSVSSELISSHVSSLSDNSIKEAEKLYPILSEEKKKKVVGGRVFIFGACNGLFWIWVSREMFLWNPSTRNIKKLPRPPFHISIHIHNGFFPGFNVSALGYDAYNDDYKIVSVVKFPIARAETMLYSLKNDSWKIINQNHSTQFCRDIRTTGKFVNGAFHWLIRPGHQDSSSSSSTTAAASYAIVPFDLSEERYGEVASLPRNDSIVMQKSLDDDQRFYDLAVLRGMLCLHCNYYSERRFILWGMQEYGVQKSWTKMFEFEYNYYHNEPFSYFPLKSFVYVVPKFLFENGELLLEARSTVVSAGTGSVAVVKYKEQHRLVTVVSGLTELGETHIYPESLVLSS